MPDGLMHPASAGDLGPLFEHIRTPARGTDPYTSHEAAEHIRQNGQLKAQAKATLEALTEYIELWGYPPTSHELAGKDLQLRYVFARRLPDLKAVRIVTNDTARRCHITGRKAVTWRPI